MRLYALEAECELAALADPDRELAEKVAARYRVAQVFDSHYSLIAGTEVDGVIVTLPSLPFAETVICDLLKAGIPVLTEKPLAYSVAAAERIVETSQRSGTLLRVGYHKRSDPAALYVKTEIDRIKASGEWGKLRYARIQVCLSGDWISGGYDDAIRSTAPAQPRPPLPEAEFYGMSDPDSLRLFQSYAGTHTHQLDLMRHLIGEDFEILHADPSRVLVVGESVSRVPVVFEFAPYESTHDWRESALVAFDQGYVKLTLPAPLARRVSGQAECFQSGDGERIPCMRRPGFPAACAATRQASNFLRLLRQEGDHTLCKAEDALKSLRQAKELTLRILNHGSA